MDLNFDGYLAEPFTFGGVQSKLDEAKVIAFGVPLDATTTFKGGTKNGPLAIREASRQTELYSMEQGKEMELSVHDIGDLWVSPANIPATLKRITEVAAKIKNAGKIPLMLGGEHTVTPGALRAFEKEKPVVIWFDAHSDLREEYMGDEICHATAARRTLDFLPKENLILLGTRSQCREEADFIKKEKITMFPAAELHRDLAKASKLLSSVTKGKQVYITLDIDVFDLSLAPGTGTPDPGGISFGEFTSLVRGVQGNLAGLDVVEVSRDAEMITASTASKAVFEILMHCSHHPLR